jgi:hypothetical protein
MIPYKIEWTEQIPDYWLFLTAKCSNVITQGNYVEVKITSDSKAVILTRPVALNCKLIRFDNFMIRIVIIWFSCDKTPIAFTWYF